MAEKLRITNKLRTLRFFAGEMTQQQLAQQAGVSRQTIIAIEAGKYTPSLELAFRLADVFGLSVEEVFMREGDAAGEGGGENAGGSEGEREGKDKGDS